MLISPARLGKVAALVSSAAFSFLFCNVARSASIIDAPIPISFGLSDYAELGYVRDRVRPAYQELENASLNLSASLNYVGLANQSLSTSIDTIGGFSSSKITAFIEVANNTYNTLSTLNGVADAKTISELGASFSPIDASVATTSLSKLKTDLNELNSQVSNPIEPPTLQLYYAVAVSGNARQKASDLRTDVLSGRTSLQNSLANINSRIAEFQTYSGQLNQASVANNRNASLLSDMMSILGANLVVKPLLENVLANQIVIDEQKRLVADTLTQLSQSADKVNQRIIESNDLINSIDYALTAEPLPSKWVTSADTGPLSSKYELFFDGRQFDYPYTEIDGRFLLGTLTIFNYISPGFGDDLSTAILEFEAFRTVIDPLLGQVGTQGVASLNMSYLATLNNDDPRASADYFHVPALGINVHILENQSFSVNVYGRYNSPLRVVAMEAVSGSIGGFITPIAVPTPALLPGLIGLGLGIWRKRKVEAES